MNATERFKRAIRYNPRDHLAEKNEYWRVYRDIQCGPTGDPRLRKTPYPERWANCAGWCRLTMRGWRRDPIKLVCRFLRLRRAVERINPPDKHLGRFFRICDARKVAYGWDYPIEKCRKVLNAPIQLTPRQKRISQLTQKYANNN